jgi:hypothetical protein
MDIPVTKVNQHIGDLYVKWHELEEEMKKTRKKKR